MAPNNKWQILTPLKFFYTSNYSLVCPATTKWDSHFLKREISSLAEEFVQPPPSGVLTFSERTLLSRWRVCPAPRRRTLSSSRRLTTNISCNSSASHNPPTAVNSQPWQPRLRFNHDYDATDITIPPRLTYSQD